MCLKSISPILDTNFLDTPEKMFLETHCPFPKASLWKASQNMSQSVLSTALESPPASQGIYKLTKRTQMEQTAFLKGYILMWSDLSKLFSWKVPNIFNLVWWMHRLYYG